MKERLEETICDLTESRDEIEKVRREDNSKMEKDRASIAELQLELSKLPRPVHYFSFDCLSIMYIRCLIIYVCLESKSGLAFLFKPHVLEQIRFSSILEDC